MTTLDRTIVPDPIPKDAEKVLPYELAKYEQNGYGAWSWGPGLPAERRLDLMPPGYAGPAALAKLERFALDSRDERSAASLEKVNDEKGVWGCDTLFRCVDACPKEVRPTDGIVGLRKSLVKNKFKRK